MAEKGWMTKVPKMTTNDGASITAPTKEAINKGFLQPTSTYSNELMVHESGPQTDGPIRGMDSWQPSVNLDDPGLDASGGWIVKKGTAFGEAAYFNQLPPGMDINNQLYLDVRPMPLKFCDNGYGYPGDSAWPVRDIPE